MFMLPNSAISFLNSLVFFCANCTLSGFLYSVALFGVISYSFHSLLISSSKSCSCFCLFVPIFTICAFNEFITSYCSSILASAFSNLAFASVFSCFKFSIFSELFDTSAFIVSISLPKFSISSSSFTVSCFLSSISCNFVSILVLAFLMSASILSSISLIEASLSSNDDTDIFKSVMSVFKLSIYVWSSLLSSANLDIS